MPVSAKPRVFISYAHKDGATLAQRLKKDLDDKDFDVWLDTQRLVGGSSWSNEIEQAIDRSDVVLALLSAGSFESNVCRGEQIRALESKKCVIPLLVHAGADNPVYLVAKQYRDFSDDTQYPLRFKDLLGDIQGRRTAYLEERYRKAGYDTRPPLPPNFVPRPAELELLRKAIISDAAEQSVALVALGGMGGIGKTVLAQALCFDPPVLDAFPDGVVWAKIGEAPTEAELIEQMKEVAKGIGEAATGFDTKEQSAKLLRSLLTNKAVLLVLDDVWRSQHVYDFLPTDARCCRILLTTRDTEVATGIGAQIRNLNVMAEQLSREVLRKYAGVMERAMPPAASAIVARCNGLPLALAMIGAEVNAQPSEYWEDIANDFAARLQLLQKELPNYGHPSLVAAMDMSLNRVDESVRQRFLKLAVLPEDTMVPETALETFWRQSPPAVRATVAILTRKSLARLEAGNLLSLHDVQLAHLRARVADLPASHQSLLESYKQRCSSGWYTGPNDGYFFNHLAYHLKEAGRTAELRQLLLDCHWLEKKLQASSVAGLLVDFDVVLAAGRRTQVLGGESIAAPPWRSIDAAVGSAGKEIASEHDPDEQLRLIQGAIRLSSNVLANDPGQFASQVVGRLVLYRDMPAIASFTQQVADGAQKPWLRSLHPALNPPGTALVRILRGHTDWVRSVALSEDGRIAVSASDDTTMKVWNVDTGLELRTLKHNGPVLGVALSGEGRTAISASKDKTMKVWNVGKGQELRTLTGHSGPVRGVALSGDGRIAVSASDDKTLKVWDVASGRELRSFTGHTGSVYGVALSGDGRIAVSASDDKTLKIWRVETGRELCTLSGHTGPVNGVALSWDGRIVVSAAADKTLKIWEVESGRDLRTLTGHEWSVLGVALSGDGRIAVSASLDNTLKLWDVVSGRELHTLAGHSSAVYGVALSKDARIAVSVSGDRTLNVWEVDSAKEMRTLSGHTDVVLGVALSGDGRIAVSASMDNTLKLWDVAGAGELRTFNGHKDWVRGVALSRDGRIAVSASQDTKLKLWDVARGRELRTFAGHSGAIYGVALSGDGQIAVSASEDTTLKIWEVGNERERRTLAGHSGAVCGVTLSEDNRVAVSASEDTTLKVWEVGSGRELRTLSGHSSAVYGVALSGDGQIAVSASGDRTLKVWEMGSGRELRTLSGHRDSVPGVALTRDGRVALSASGDSTLKVWGVKEGACLATFTCDGATFCCACFDPLKLIVAGDLGGHVHFLRLEEP